MYYAQVFSGGVSLEVLFILPLLVQVIQVMRQQKVAADLRIVFSGKILVQEFCGYVRVPLNQVYELFKDDEEHANDSPLTCSDETVPKSQSIRDVVGRCDLSKEGVLKNWLSRSLLPILVLANFSVY
jgi:uncharacterized paraquat-inducible protein A